MNETPTDTQDGPTLAGPARSLRTVSADLLRRCRVTSYDEIAASTIAISLPL